MEPPPKGMPVHHKRHGKGVVMEVRKNGHRVIEFEDGYAPSSLVLPLHQCSHFTSPPTSLVLPLLSLKRRSV